MHVTIPNALAPSPFAPVAPSGSEAGPAEVPESASTVESSDVAAALGSDRVPDYGAFCTECGTRLPEDARFCQTCGRPMRYPDGTGSEN